MADLNYTVGVETAQGIASLKRLQDTVNRTQQNFSALQTTIAGLALGGFVVNAYRMAAAFNDIATATGVALEGVIGFGQAIAANGGSIESANAGLLKFTRFIEEAKNGSKEAKNTLNDLGISTSELYTNSTDENLQLFLDRIGELRTEGQRLDTTFTVFGKSLASADLQTAAEQFKRFREEAGLTADAMREADQAEQNFGQSLFVIQKQLLITLKPISELAKEMLSASSAVGKFAAVLFDLAIIIGSFTLVAKGAALIGGAFKILKDAFVAVGAALSMLGRTWTVFLDQMGRMMRAGEVTSATISGLGTRLGWFGRALGIAIPAVATLGTALYGVFNLVRKFLGGDEVKQGESPVQTQAEKDAEALKKLQAGYQEFFDKAKQYVNTDYRTELEKASERVVEAQTVVAKLNEALARGAIDTSTFNKYMKAAQQELQAAGKEFDAIKEKLDDVGFNKFYNDLTKGSKAAVDEQQYMKDAVVKLAEDLERGKISLAVYTEAMKLLNKESELAAQKLRDLQQENQKFINGLERSTSDLQFEFNALNMDPLSKQIEDIKRKIDSDLKGRIEELNKQRTAGNTSEIDAMIKASTEAAERAKTQQAELAESIYQTQRTFSHGWAKSWREYSLDATNAAQAAQRVFNTATKGMEDAIVGFVRTGKFEFKDLLNTIAEELLRSEIRSLIAQLFGPAGGNNSGGGSLLGGVFSAIKGAFGGLFANGGTLGAGKWGIAGERGPEIISGPASITPMNGMGGGGGYVTYNINAVDAASFKAMIARDPGFIHAVAMQGAGSIARRR
jgi:hypothetical protein